MKRSNFVRKLISGKEALELEKKVFLQIYTNCPEKWQLTDLETGDQYILIVVVSISLGLQYAIA